MKPAATHSVAVGAVILVIVAVGTAWIASLRAGPKLGLEAGAMVVMVPLALAVLTAMWLVARAMFGGRLRLGAIGTTALGALMAFVIVAFTCGPVACFQAGPNRGVGWFLVGGVALAALVHHVLLGWLTRPASGTD